ncbi:hypothetical protein [Flavobacterium sp.]|uniref:hypothetical protein n=1 Tax=Flavobacterium sp. TaxID=239 RepID=UPI0039E7147F
MEKITIDLKDFLLTGNFGPVVIGMTKDDVIHWLGDPGQVHDFKSGSAVLFYNGFELFYSTDDDQLYAIQNDNLYYLFEENAPYPINEKVSVDTSFLHFGKPLTLGNLKDYLAQQQIDFEIVHKDEYDEIVLESGVKFDFENRGSKPDACLLNGIRYFKY